MKSKQRHKHKTPAKPSGVPQLTAIRRQRSFNNHCHRFNNIIQTAAMQTQTTLQELPQNHTVLCISKTKRTKAACQQLIPVVLLLKASVFMLHLVAINFQVATATSQPCQLPPTWAGKWYQANKEPIRITNTEISDKGICRDKKGDKYLFEYPQQSCLTCLVINERQLNVLQYKESTCQPITAQQLQQLDSDDHTLLDSICSDITGDAQLESLFRLDTPPIECPISGKYNFTYDNCRDPHSSLDSCIDKKQLNFKYSACPDVPGSESKNEHLECYADWSEANNYYMIGRLKYASNPADIGKFRCIIYEKFPNGSIQMAQSLEESCYGIINPNEGPKTLSLTPRQQTNTFKCHFPAYIKDQSENWLSVDNTLIYMFNQNSTKYQVKETREGNVIEEAACLQQFSVSNSQLNNPHASHSATTRVNYHHPPSSRRFPPSGNHAFNQVVVDQTSSLQATSAASSLSASKSTPAINDVIYLIQITKNCQTTDYCVRFHRRTSGIVQIDYFIAVPGGDISQRCKNAFVSAPQTQIITSTNLEQQRCPFEGAYTIEAPTESDLSYNPSNIFICPRQSFLTAQCDQPSRMRIHYKCSSQNAALQMPAKQMIKNLYCLGSWTSNGLVRLLLADDERQRYSAWYRDYATINNQLVPAATASSFDMTRSQQLLALAQQQPLVASIVDLQIALITPTPTIAKPMQARLTRRNQCSDLRTFLANSQASSSLTSSWFGYPGHSSNLPLSSVPASGYASISSSSSAAHPSLVSANGWMTNVVNLIVIIVTLLILRTNKFREPLRMN